MSDTTTASRLLFDRYYTFASLIILSYDTLVTISIEVEKIWKRRYTGLTILWFLNRWHILLALVPFLISFFERTWTEKKFVYNSPSSAIQKRDGHLKKLFPVAIASTDTPCLSPLPSALLLESYFPLGHTASTSAICGLLL